MKPHGIGQRDEGVRCIGMLQGSGEVHQFEEGERNETFRQTGMYEIGQSLQGTLSRIQKGNEEGQNVRKARVLRW